MRKKGLVYRVTTLLGLSIIFLQFGGEVLYAKYYRQDRDEEIKEVTNIFLLIMTYSKMRMRTKRLNSKKKKLIWRMT